MRGCTHSHERHVGEFCVLHARSIAGNGCREETKEKRQKQQGSSSSKGVGATAVISKKPGKLHNMGLKARVKGGAGGGG